MGLAVSFEGVHSTAGSNVGWYSESVASPGWVTPGAATEGVTPLFTWRPFLVASSAVSPLTTFLTTFFCSSLYRFLLLSLGCLGCHPPRGCHPTPFLPVRPRFSTILCKFAHKNFFYRVSPPGRFHPGRSAPLVTPLPRRFAGGQKPGCYRRGTVND